MSAEVPMGARLFVVCLSMAMLAGCGDDRPRGGRGAVDSGTPMGDGGVTGCGNGVREGEEACDGFDLGGQSCLGLGLGGGALSCSASCTLDASGCETTCTPNCEGRQCGFDPACPTASCGQCGEGTCDAEGMCAGLEPGAPRVLSLTSDGPFLLGPSDEFNIVALVEDPDGVESLTGGQLEDASGEVVYGDFLNFGAGRFQFPTTLGQLNEYTSLEAPAGGAELTLRARFFDSTGLAGTSSVSVRIGCSSAPLCGNECPDIATDPNHCGACGSYCEGECTFGECGVPDSPPIVEYIFSGTCDAGCSSLGYVCDPSAALPEDDLYGPACEGAAVCVYSYDTGDATPGNCSVPIASLLGVEGGEASCACRAPSAD